MGNLYYELKGSSNTTVFLHGYMESITMWKHMTIPEGMQAIFVDMPGHGKSQLADHPYASIADIAQKISDLLGTLDVQAFNVVGHSMGGYVALELKKSDPRCQRIMLLNSNFWEDSAQKKKDRLRVAEIARYNHALLVKEAIPALFSDPIRFNFEVNELVEEAIQMDPEGIVAGAVAMRNRLDNEELVRKYPKDIMIVQGAKDTVVPAKLMREKINGIDVEYHEVQGVGHMMHISAPGILEELIAHL